MTEELRPKKAVYNPRDNVDWSECQLARAFPTLETRRQQRIEAAQQRARDWHDARKNS
jgi:hypothetical protein